MEKLRLLHTLLWLHIHQRLSNHFSILDDSWIWKVYPEENVKHFAGKYGSVKQALSILLD